MTRDTAQLALGVIVCASITVLAHAILDWNPVQQPYGVKQGYWIWAFVISTTSILVCLAAWLFLGPWTENVAAEKAMKVVHLIFISLALLWLGGASVLTFRRPFQSEGNGYFASFVALLTSVFASIELMPTVKEYFEKFSRGGAVLIPLLFIASGTVLIQSAIKCSNVGNFPEANCLYQRGWIQACPVIALCLSFLLLIPPVGHLLAPHFKYIAGLLFAVWAAGAYVGTFVGPYLSPMEADGYFGCWAAYASCIFLLDGSLSWNSVQTEKHTSLIAGTHFELLALLSSSICVFVAGAIICCNNMSVCSDYNALAVYSGVISTSIVLLLLVVRFLHIQPEKLDSLMQFVSSFLLAGWIGAFGCMTYRAPFTNTGNGFYGCWVSLLSSGLLFTRYFSPFRQLKEYTGVHNAVDILSLWAASILLVVQLAVDQQANLTVPYGSDWIWGIVVCVSTMLFLPAIQVKVLSKKPVAVIALLLLAGWAAAVGVFTFKYPYIAPSNGYFATWIGFLGAARFFRHNFFQLFEQPLVNTPEVERPAPVQEIVQVPVEVVIPEQQAEAIVVPEMEVEF